jgi:hypothetical protein
MLHLSVEVFIVVYFCICSPDWKQQQQQQHHHHHHHHRRRRRRRRHHHHHHHHHHLVSLVFKRGKNQYSWYMYIFHFYLM